MLISIIGALFAFTIIVFIHEFGHFLVAKLSGIKVLAFSIGFGPVILKWSHNDTEYRISAIPLGGYVKMQGEYELQDDEKMEDYVPKKGDFMYAHPFKRILVALAGPLFNFILALFILVGILMYQGEQYYDTTKIAKVYKKSEIINDWKLKAGDEIKAINGETVNYFDEVWEKIEKSKNENLLFLIKRNDEELKINCNRDSLKQTYTFLPYIDTIIGEVLTGGPAANAGLMRGDRILSINNMQFATWWDMTEYLSKDESEEYSVHYLRNGKVDSLKITPEIKKEVAMDGTTIKRKIIGVTVYLKEKKLTFFNAISSSIIKLYNLSKLFFYLIGKLITGGASPKVLGGPIQIFQVAGQYAKSGFIDLLNLIALLSVNLGILNLLPLPVMDGGQILFFSAEFFTGKPISMRLRLVLQSMSMILLFMLLIYVSFNDILRIFGN